MLRIALAQQLRALERDRPRRGRGGAGPDPLERVRCDVGRRVVRHQPAGQGGGGRPVLVVDREPGEDVEQRRRPGGAGRAARRRGERRLRGRPELAGRALAEGHDGEPVRRGGGLVWRAGVAHRGEQALGVVAAVARQRDARHAELAERGRAVLLGQRKLAQRLARLALDQQRGAERRVSATEERGERRAPEPVAQRHLGARGVALAQQREPAIEAREVGTRVGRIRAHDALDHLAPGCEVAALEGHLGGEQQRIRRAGIAGRRAHDLEQLAARVGLAPLLEIRPGERGARDRRLRVARELDEHATERGAGGHEVARLVRGLALQQ